MPSAFPLTAFSDYLISRLSYGSRRLYLCYLRKILTELERTGRLGDELRADDILEAVRALPDSAQSVARSAYRAWVEFCAQENLDSLEHGGEGCWVPPELPLMIPSRAYRASNRIAVAAFAVWYLSRRIRRMSLATFASLTWDVVTIESTGVVVVTHLGSFRWDAEAVPAWNVLLAETRGDGHVTYATEGALRALIRRGEHLVLHKQTFGLMPDLDLSPKNAASTTPPTRPGSTRLDHDNPDVSILPRFRCSRCGRPVWTTPAGETCRAGHAGEFEPGEPTADDVL